MIQLTVERDIAAPATAVFDWLADSSNYVSAPLVLRERRVRDGAQAPYGRGAIREITAIGAWFREEITLYERPREFGYLILKSLPRLEHHGGSITFEEHDGRTRAIWRTSYDVPGAWGGDLMAKILEPVLRWSFGSLLAGAERALVGAPDAGAHAGRNGAPDSRSHAPFALMNHLGNPAIRAILRSPAHALLSRRLTLITFTGRRSGRSFTIPVLYEQAGEQLKIPVEWPARKRWWRNLRDEAPVRVELRGDTRAGRAIAREREGSVSVEVMLDAGA